MHRGFYGHSAQHPLTMLSPWISNKRNHSILDILSLSIIGLSSIHPHTSIDESALADTMVTSRR